MAVIKGRKNINLEFAHRIAKNSVPVSRVPEINGFQGVPCLFGQGVTKNGMFSKATDG
ncbi:MAG: hypothetical protein RSC31_04185 [Anaerovoracaceae bacterium]